MKLFLFVLTLVALACHCQASNVYHFDFTDNNTLNTITENDKVIVELEGNPTTGFKWDMFYLEGGAILQDGEPSYEKDNSHHGKPGLYRFFYRGFQPGHAKLRFVYARHWETTNPKDSFNIQVRVHRP